MAGEQPWLRACQALKTCEAALAGRALVRPVREAFAAFAEDRGVLAPQALEASVARAAGEWLSSEPAERR